MSFTSPGATSQQYVLPTEEEFRVDIQQAYDRGSITLGETADLFGKDDLDTYFSRGTGNFPNISNPNHANLSALGEEVGRIMAIRNSEHQKLCWLELGSGLGIAAGSAHRMDYRVDVVSRTALAPHFIPNPGIQDLMYHYQQQMDLRLLAQTSPEPFRSIVQEIIRPLPEPFSRVETPFVERQYIGMFPQETTLPAETYDIIHEQCGPLYYGRDQRERLLPHILSSLKPSGVLVAPLDNPERFGKTVLGHRPWKAVWEKCDGIIAFGPESIFSQIGMKQGCVADLMQSIRSFRDKIWKTS
jgi:SAM-dependent methyltransferase